MIHDDGSTLSELAAEDRQCHELAQVTRARLTEAVRDAYRAGWTKAEIHRETGISRPTINAWIAAEPPALPPEGRP